MCFVATKIILAAAPANDSPGDAATQPHSGQCSDDWDGDVNTLPTCPGDATAQLTSAPQWPVF